MNGRIVTDKESIKRYINDYYRYKKSRDIESVYILLYVRETKKLLDKIKIINENYKIVEKDCIELHVSEYDEIGYKVTYKRGDKLIDKSLVILEKLKEQERTREVNIYIRLDIDEIENLVEDEGFVCILSEEDMIEIKEDYLENIRINGNIKTQINILLDNYKEELNIDLYKLVIQQKENERDMLELLRKNELYQTEIVRE